MVKQAELRNRILSRLSPDDFALLIDQLEPVQCERGVVLAEIDQPMNSLIFFERGIASVVTRSPEGNRSECGFIGRDGFIHPALLLGSDRIPYTLEMQLPDEGFRISRRTLLDAVERSPSLRETLLRFALVHSVQCSFTALSNAIHQVEERLARWLLMCHDRSESDDLPLTHDFMGLMLSVRRPTVTNALHILEGLGFIESTRGNITIRNRAAMEEFASDAYGRPEAEYRRLLGPL